MAKERNQALMVFIGGITPGQAAELSSMIIRAKDKVAPEGRATMAKGNLTKIGGLMQKKMPQITQNIKNGEKKYE